MNLQIMLGEIAEAGGEINVLESYYAPFDREAVGLGLVTVKDINSGWGFTETLSLTDRGRLRMGLQHRMQPAPTVWHPLIAALLGKLRSKLRIFVALLTEDQGSTKKFGSAPLEVFHRWSLIPSNS